MTTPKVVVDFNGADEKGRLSMSCQGTLRDLARQGIHLANGLVLSLYQNDANEEGRPQQLVAEGVIEYSQEEQAWVAVIDWDAIQYVPAALAAATNGTAAASTQTAAARAGQ